MGLIEICDIMSRKTSRERIAQGFARALRKTGGEYELVPWGTTFVGQQWILSAIYKTMGSKGELALDLFCFRAGDVPAGKDFDRTDFFAANNKLLITLLDLHAAGKLDKVFKLLSLDGAPARLEVKAEFAVPKVHHKKFLNEPICRLHIRDNEFCFEPMLSLQREMLFGDGSSPKRRIAFHRTCRNSKPALNRI